MGAVVTVLLGLEVPLKLDGSGVARVGSDSSESEELPQAETNKSRAHATPAISFPLLIRLNSLCTNCYYIPSLKAVQQMSNNRAITIVATTVKQIT